MASDAPLAVVCAHYTGHRSRILLWETERDIFHPGQWLRGGITPCDISPDGRYFAYYVAARKKVVPYYLAVSRPPFLTALFFRPLAYDGGVARFSGGWISWWGAATDNSQDPDHPEYGYGRLTPGGPYRIHETDADSLQERNTLWHSIARRDAGRPAVDRAVGRFGQAAEDLLRDPRRGIGLVPAADPYLARAPRRDPGYPSQVQSTWDHQNRLIVAIKAKVLAFSPDTGEMTELLDLSQTVFSTMPTPNWAKEW